MRNEITTANIANTLTAEELQLINERRAAANKTAAEAEARRNEKIAAEMAKRETRIANALQRAEIETAAAVRFFADLDPAMWTLETTNDERPFTICVEGEWSTLNTVNIPTTKIVSVPRVDGIRFMVTAHAEIVNAGRFNERVTSTCYMHISGTDIDSTYSRKKITRTITIEKKVKEIIQAREYAASHALKTKMAIALTVNKYTSLYPGATILAGKTWENTHNGRGFQVDIIIVTFPNGIKVVNRVFSDGSTGNISVSYPRGMDVLQAVSQIS